MRSIRRSLVLYFLGLMAVVLGAVGVLIDRVAGRTLASREAATLQLIDLRHADQVQELRDQFDAELSSTARVVANDVQMNYYLQGQKNFDHYFSAMRVAPLGSLAAGLSPFPIAVPLWNQINFNRRINEELARKHFSLLHLDELPSVESRQGTDLIHVSVEANPRPRVYITRSLEGENWNAVGPQFNSSKLIDELFESRVTRGGVKVRVVGLKSPISVLLRSPGGRTYFPGGGPERRAPRAESPSPSSQPPPRTETEQPPQIPFRTAYIQCGRSMAQLDDRLNLLEIRRDEEKAQESIKTARDRFGLRAWLGLIGSLAFLGLIAGGLMLVKRGLRPLDTLTRAVAKVSEKDFRLPVEPQELSKELLPIHDRITETLSQLKRAFDHDKQAVADISHELRTPVASLLATIDVTLRKPRTAEEYKQKFEDCRVITKQMAGLVERVMMLASLDATPATVTTTNVDGAELARGVATVIRPLAEAHGLSFTVDAPNAIPLQTDADKLREVLLNLLHNAIEYNRPGGSIALSVSNGGPSAVFTVKDTGIGMTEHVRQQIFNRFYRADASRTATGLHAGLGLAIVKECVDRLGGRIRVESRPGIGSEFTVELPA